MATLLQEVLTADQMSLTLFCGGMGKVGVNLAGTWTGTVTFLGTTDGLNFRPVAVTPFPSGATVNSATVNGSWEFQCQNFVAFKALFSRTSGSVTCKLAASVDSSYQDAFLTPTSIYVNGAASGATNTVTQPAQANRAWRLRTLVVTVNSAATWVSSPNVQVTDGASSVIWAGDIPTTAGVYTIPLPADPNTPGITGGGLVGTPGNSMVITVASGGGAVKTNIDAEFHAA